MTGLRLTSIVFFIAITGCPAKDGTTADAGPATTLSAAVSAIASAAPTAAATASAPATTSASASAVTSAAASASAKPKSNVPTCKAGQVLGTIALSPFKPVCGAKCKTDADCTGGAMCMDVNALKADGSIVDGAQAKICLKDF